MMKSNRALIAILTCAAGLSAAYFLTRPAAVDPAAPAAGDVAPGAPAGTTVNAALTAARAADRFAGEWEQTSGTAKVVCNGKLAKEEPLAGKRFKLTRSADGLTFSDKACEFPLAVDGTRATAKSEHCTPSNPEAPIITIGKQSIDSADGKVASVVFEGSFHVDLPDVGKQMDCSVTVNSSARRL